MEEIIMPLFETEKQLLGQTASKLLSDVWKKVINNIINDEYLSTQTDKFQGVMAFANVIQYSYNIQGFNEQNFEVYFKKLSEELGYFKENNPLFYRQTLLYRNTKVLRNILRADQSTLLSPDVGFSPGLVSSPPTPGEIQNFMQPLLGKAFSIITEAFNPNNQLKIDRSYVDDILQEVFYPTLANRLPGLIIENLGQHTSIAAKDQQLSKMLKIFYPDLGVERTAVLKDVFLKVDQVNVQLKQLGYGESELAEANKYYQDLMSLMKPTQAKALELAKATGKKGSEMFGEMQRLLKHPINPFPQQEPQLTEELAKKFAISTQGFDLIGTQQVTPDILDRHKHFSVLYGAYKTAISLTTDKSSRDEVPIIDNLRQELSLKSSFLANVQTLPLASDKAK